MAIDVPSRNTLQ